MSHRFAFVFLVVCTMSGARLRAESPALAATAAYDSALAHLEARLSQQHRSDASYLVLPARAFGAGQPLIEPLASAQSLPGAMLHHWRGTAFVPGAHAADFERLLRNFSAYPRLYSPQVLSARLLAHPQPDRYQVQMRLRQHHLLTVVLDTGYEVSFSHLDAAHGASASLGTSVVEIVDPGSVRERALSSAEEHGFLWRIDSFWSWAERDGGLVIQIESLTLTRGIPRGLGWAVGPFVQSIPRDSLEFTLRSTAAALERRK